MRAIFLSKGLQGSGHGSSVVHVLIERLFDGAKKGLDLDYVAALVIQMARWRIKINTESQCNMMCL